MFGILRDSGWLLDLDKVSLRLFIGFIKGHCDMTGMWNRIPAELLQDMLR